MPFERFNPLENPLGFREAGGDDAIQAIWKKFYECDMASAVELEWAVWICCPSQPAYVGVKPGGPHGTPTLIRVS